MERSPCTALDSEGGVGRGSEGIYIFPHAQILQAPQASEMPWLLLCKLQIQSCVPWCWAGTVLLLALNLHTQGAPDEGGETLSILTGGERVCIVSTPNPAVSWPNYLVKGRAH